MKNSIINPIAILDGQTEGLPIFHKIISLFPNQSFIYINDVANYPNYQNTNDYEMITFHVNSMLEKLKEYNCHLVICVNSFISVKLREFFAEYKDLKIIHLTDLVISYVNSNYPKKELVLLGKSSVLKENYLQKELSYKHLYNLSSDELEKIILENKTKTALSFTKVNELFKNVINRDIDFVVYCDAFLDELYLEFGEYLNDVKRINLLSLLQDKLIALDVAFMVDKKREIYLLSTLDKSLLDKENYKKLLNKKLKVFTYEINFIREEKKQKKISLNN